MNELVTVGFDLPSAELTKRHPSRSVSPLPRAPAFPSRADKAFHHAKTRLMNKSNPLFWKKDRSEEEMIPPEKLLFSTACEAFTNGEVIADVYTVEETNRLTKWTNAIFSRTSWDSDNGSTSTATSSSTLSEETFTNSTPVLLTSTHLIVGEIAISETQDESPLPSPITVPQEPCLDAVDSPVPITPKPRRVCFNAKSPDIYHLDESVGQMSSSEKSCRWYSRAEIAQQRQEMKQAILQVRQNGLGTNIFVHDDALMPSHCVTGCERYYSAENRFMAQKMMIEAIVENIGSTDEELREISRNLSRPNRELALWHAKLTAVQCWGLDALKKNGVFAQSNERAQVMKPISSHVDLGCLTPTPPSSQPRPTVDVVDLDLSLSPELAVPFLSNDVPDGLQDQESVHLIPRMAPFQGNCAVEAHLDDSKILTVQEEAFSKTQSSAGGKCSQNQEYLTFQDAMKKWREIDSSMSCPG